MKKLTRLLLVNWHYFQKQIIDFGNISFLTGKNSVGKSTIIDAMQIVLLGEIKSSAFNRAASKKSDRTLKSYLLGSMGEDVNTGVKNIREGKDFSTYIVAEFYDDVKNERFCTGVIFDVFADGGDITKRFFYLRNSIPEHCFILSGKTMSSRETTRFFKEKYPNRYQTVDTAEGYKKLILAKFNVHEEKFFTMMKKAISFEPINDIEKFVTENICDIEDNIDIRSMQENIQYYRQQEEIAKKFQEKLNSLAIICNKYEELEKYRARGLIQRFLIDYSNFEDFREQLKKAHKEAEEYDINIAEFSEKYDELVSHKERLEQQRDELRSEKEKYWITNNGDNLEKEKERLSTEIESFERKINSFVNEMRTHALKWVSYSEKCTELSDNEYFTSAIHELAKLLVRLENISISEINNISIAYFTQVREKFLEAEQYIKPYYYELKREKAEFEEKEENLRIEINKLKQGLKTYPVKAIKLRDAISDGLRKKYNKDIKVYFLADIIDVTDEEWHNVVEGYLNTQRMNIIVPPEYFMDAYVIYKSIQFSEKIHEYAVVDLKKVHEYNPKVMSGSLSEIVKSDDIYVQSYINYLLGRVIRCYGDDSLRDNHISVTKDCMLYSNFSVKALNQSAYLTPYIGRKSIQKQIDLKTQELETIQSIMVSVETKISNISSFTENEWFLSENYISSTVEDIFAVNSKLPIKRSELDEIIKKIDEIDFFWLEKMDKKITDVELQINTAEEEARETDHFIQDWKYEKKERVDKIIPTLTNYAQQAETHLSEAYTEEYISSQGLPRYEQEIKRCGTAVAVKESFASSLKKTETLIQHNEENLIGLRSEYNRQQNISFNVADTLKNTEYEDEYRKISEYELPHYIERIEKAKQDAMEQFKSDFLYRLRSNIQNAFTRIDELNTALKRTQFGNDTYRFEIKPNSTYREYYDMIMSELLENGTSGLFGYEFTERYQSTIDNLFTQILSMSDNDTGKTAQNVAMFSKYKTYLTFDILSTDVNGRTDRLSKSIFTKSGGETQTPFYIAILASFAYLYRVNDSSDYGNTIRIVIFDEAFNKMDNERIIESVRLLRKFGLQAIVCTPPDKAADLHPLSDKTLLVHKEQTGKIYQSTVIEWSKEFVDEL